MLNSDLTRDDAERLVANGEADAISFGRLYISNPDLVLRFARDLPLADYDRDTSYARGPDGYTDYPAAIV